MSENKNKFIIYKHTSPSGKVYIGQTCQSESKRYRSSGQGYKGCSYFYNAIKRYGWENFEHEVLDIDLTQEQANILEVIYISYYKSNNKRYGYNLAIGGSSCAGIKRTDEFKKHISEFFKGKPLSEEHKKKISLSNKGKTISEEQKRFLSECNKGKKLSEETRKKMSLSQTGRVVSEETRRKMSLIFKGRKLSPEMIEVLRQAHLGKPSWNKGKAWSEEWKQKMSEQSKNRKDLVKPIICIETGIQYISSAEAGRQLHTSPSHISSCCKGKRKTAGGYHWKYVEDDKKQKESN